MPAAAFDGSSTLTLFTMPFVSLDDLNASEKIPGYVGRFVHSETMTMARWEVEAGRSFPEHSHPHEQFSIVVSGTFELTIEGETEVLDAGRMAVIPADATHSGQARTDCEIIDVFHPVREEYQNDGAQARPSES